MNRDQTILIVDDDERNIVALSAVLKIKGYCVLDAVSGQSGIDKLWDQSFIDIVLMDIMMPEMDGYETIKRIRNNHIRHDIPIIAITAKNQEEDMQKCLEVGATDYCAKPIEINQLINKIETHLVD